MHVYDLWVYSRASAMSCGLHKSDVYACKYMHLYMCIFNLSAFNKRKQTLNCENNKIIPEKYGP